MIVIVMLQDKPRVLFRPVSAIVFFSIVYYLAASIIVYLGYYTSVEFENIWHFTISLLVAWWVIEDKKKQNYHAPFEFGAFVYFAWILVVPYYLWRTRGCRGLGWSILVVMYFFLPNIYWHVVETYWWTN